MTNFLACNNRILDHLRSNIQLESKKIIETVHKSNPIYDEEDEGNSIITFDNQHSEVSD